MTRKFLFCFPLRVGNIVFGYTVIIIAIAVMTYNLYCLGLSVVPEEQEVSLVNKSMNGQEKFRNWENVEQLFGHEKNSLVTAITMIYFISYSTIAFLLLVFGAVFICGAYKANYCLVSTFFVYSFFHLFLTVGLIVLEATSAGYIQLGLVLLSDVLLIICLFGVKYLMEAIRAGNIYSRPGEVFYRY